MFGDKLAEHLAVVLRHEDAFHDHVVPLTRAVANRVGQQADVVPVRHVVLA
jgi:hypothetical protein